MEKQIKEMEFLYADEKLVIGLTNLSDNKFNELENILKLINFKEYKKTTIRIDYNEPIYEVLINKAHFNFLKNFETGVFLIQDSDNYSLSYKEYSHSLIFEYGKLERVNIRFKINLEIIFNIIKKLKIVKLRFIAYDVNAPIEIIMHDSDNNFYTFIIATMSE